MSVGDAAQHCPSILKRRRHSDVERLLIPERRASQRSDSITVEIVGARRFQTMRHAWDDLVQRACEPNPFLDPAIVAAAAGSEDSADQIPILLAWGGARLLGVWAFSLSAPPSRLPLTVLAAPLREMLPNATPVIDADHVVAVLTAMIDAIARVRDLPKLLSIDMINDGGPVMTAFREILASRNCPLVVLRRSQRPMLNCSASPAEHFKKMLSGNARRTLNWRRRRLSGRGDLQLTVHHERDAAVAATERFITLEASGWKANSGASEAARIQYREFIRNAVAGLAGDGKVEVWELTLDTAPVSMALFLRHRSGVYCWKIAYDERHADCAPGVMLVQDYTTAFLTDPEIALADSCAADDTGVHNKFWDGRQPIVRLVADVRPGGSLAFSAWAAFEVGARKLRDVAKAALQGARRRLRKAA